ncbi:MAG: hypoxanthine phosphoribosyltransferase [Clostridia bacterium]|jgi:hypoxanthine phosphoribosyltransferase|nr:hypoxanthine phosphoribosyltransferase [Clostridia bacterium]
MKIKTLISSEELQKRIKEIGKQITEEYKNKEIVIICILRGAVYFATDLTKYIDSNNLIMEFMQVSSYGNMKETTGELKIKKDLDVNIEGKNVIIVEDIIDSGFTMLNLKKYLLSKNPETLKVCTLLDKKDRRKVEVEADYVGFEIPNKFVLGYGLDYEEYYRNLPYIAYSED